MKKLIFIICVILMSSINSGCSLVGIKRIPPEEIQKIVAEAKDSKIIVVDIYHNSCPSCKLIEPVIEKLTVDYSQNKDIYFLKYDLSNPFTVIDSKKIAKELGLESIYKAQKYSGVVLFIDNEKKLVLDTLIAEHNIKKYNEIISKRLYGTQSAL